MTRPVAVLMSVYKNDHPDHFLQAVNSILSQRLSDDIAVRIYLAVDGPIHDAMHQAINSIEHKLFTLVTFEQNRGLAVALNNLITKLRDEELIFRMDSDDISKPERFAAQISYMDTHPTVDIVGTSIIEFNEQGDANLVHFARDNDAARRSAAKRVPVAHPTICIRRKVLTTLGGYPLNTMNEDVALWFRCFHANFTFANIMTPLYEFRISNNFWMRRNSKKALSEFLIYYRGIIDMGGPSWKLIFPLMRLFIRHLPARLQRSLYSSRWRKN